MSGEQFVAVGWSDLKRPEPQGEDYEFQPPEIADEDPATQGLVRFHERVRMGAEIEKLSMAALGPYAIASQIGTKKWELLWKVTALLEHPCLGYPAYLACPYWWRAAIQLFRLGGVDAIKLDVIEAVRAELQAQSDQG